MIFTIWSHSRTHSFIFQSKHDVGYRLGLNWYSREEKQVLENVFLCCCSFSLFKIKCQSVSYVDWRPLNLCSILTSGLWLEACQRFYVLSFFLFLFFAFMPLPPAPIPLLKEAEYIPLHMSVGRSNFPFRSITFKCMNGISWNFSQMLPRQRRCVSRKNQNKQTRHSYFVGFWVVIPFLIYAYKVGV